MAESDDHIALAAEYALGTLDADERAQVEAMMSDDPGFSAVVQAWEQRLGALNQMVGSVEPRPEVWDRIKAAISRSEPLESRSAPAASLDRVSAGPAASGNTNIIRLTSKIRRWRNVATAASALAAALVAMIAVGVSVPDLLPERMRPAPRIQVVDAKAPPAPKPSAQYVAVLQKDGGSPAFILTVDDATKNFTVRTVEAPAEAGKSFELWLISDKLPRPRSLGVIGGSEFTSRPLLASFDPQIVKTATYAVTVEQAGGSPDGAPHSSPVFTGRLIEAVPSPAR
jgi:anti-sigma-K factor RskA